MAISPPLAARRIVEALQSSPLYRLYQAAFRDATGMPMFLRQPDSDAIPLASERAEQNPFCQALNAGGAACSACHSMHHELKARAEETPRGGTCFARMNETAIPVRSGGRVIAFLWTGQVFTEGSGPRGFEEVERTVRGCGFNDEETSRLRALWGSTPEVKPERYAGVITLLHAFAFQVSNLADTILLGSGHGQEPESVMRAKRHVRDHLGERLPLAEVARAAGLSPYHFCRVFRAATGLPLNDYINRCRIDAARGMLLKADARISEVAYEVGYRSLSQFNRVFRALCGECPGDYRRRILKPEKITGGAAS